MNICDYQVAALRTSGVTIGEDMVNNAVLGLIGEVGEVVDLIKKVIFHGHPIDKDAFSKEIGDVFWYIALLCEGTKEVSFTELVRPLPLYPDQPSSAILQEELFETGLRLGAGVGHIARLTLSSGFLTEAIYCLFDELIVLLYLLNLDLENVLATNIAKLQLRYPQGFNTESSLNRGDA